ncbi:MAG: Gfo/Idh/MocA family oxidoreductase [Verrucomicrobia bacterium]|nr:Gfo/Idh/MocA family oxidoreductase [Verrucomicrobiota bacterium]
MKTWNRREFSKAVVLATAASASTAASRARVLGANDRVRLGFIGLGNRGDQVLDAFLEQPDAEVVALCDLFAPYVEFAARKIGHPTQRFQDYRRLIEVDGLDAVVISTPDHWHALQTIHACEAGKDVYVEKPLSLCVAEGRAMVEAVRRHGRVCQVGIHRRSAEFCRAAAALVREGGLGKVTVARAFHIQNEWPKGIGNPPDTDPPTELDWETWLGPAPRVPYNLNRTFYRFRWFYGYSGGQLTNFGVHYLDFIHWALGQEAPLRVTALGGKFAGIEDNREIPDTLEVLWEYPGQTLVTFSQFNASAGPWSLPGCEIELRGTRGTLYLFGNRFEVVPDAITPNEFPARRPDRRAYERGWRTGEKPQIEPRKVTGSGDTAYHARNFLDCVKSRARCHCDIEMGHRSTTATLLGNIALQTRAVLDWDAQREQFPNHPEANRLLRYSYRAPYQFPSAPRGS